MNTVIIKYNAGNTQSVYNALQRLGVTPTVSDDFDTIAKADKVIFPGVGHAYSAMAYLKEKKLDQLIPQLSQDVLGICLGMQLMCSHSAEGDVDCLGIFPERVVHFGPIDEKVPHMGWTPIRPDAQSALFKDVPSQSYTYHVHSYYVPESEYCIARAQHGLSFCTAMHRQNFYAVQFHPEKSADIGSTILNNFLAL